MFCMEMNSKQNFLTVTFVEMTHKTKTFWYLQFPINTRFQVQNQTRLPNSTGKNKVFTNLPCLISIWYEVLNDGVWIYWQLFFNYEM